MSMKIISWNINGIKSLIKTGYFEEIFAEKPDILCLQEVKSAEISDVENYYSYLFPSQKRVNFSGTAVYTKIKPVSIGLEYSIDDVNSNSFFYFNVDY